MIEQIIIENYKSIHNTKIELKNLNVIIGANGVGKSNFISFFELIQKMIDQRLGNYILEKGGIGRFLYQGLKHSDYIKGLIDFDNTNAFFFKLKPTINNKAFIEYSGDYYNWNEDTNKDYSNDKKWNKTYWDKNVEESDIINKTYRAKYLVKYIKSFTVYHFHDTSETSPMRSLNCNLNDNEYLRSDASNLAAFLYRLQKTEPKAFKLIEGTIKSIAPYFKCFDLQPSQLNPSEIIFKWEEEGSDMYLDSHSFSDGTLRFIALTTVLLQPNLPSTIIIDEPELGLHPSAIKKLAAMIKRASTKTQVIVATQSVNLVNCFEASDIIVADRKEKQTVFNRLSQKELSSWLEDYNLGEIWEKNIIGG